MSKLRESSGKGVYLPWDYVWFTCDNLIPLRLYSRYPMNMFSCVLHLIYIYIHIAYNFKKTLRKIGTNEEQFV